MSTLSTHVLDTMHGRPAAGLAVVLTGPAGEIARATTDADGRCPGLAPPGLAAGRYALAFAVADYFRALGVALAEPPFLDEVTIAFGIAGDGGHYHVPLLVSPYAYSTYRGELMAVDLTEWLNLSIRWLHLTAGIAWIGASFYFIWLDNHLTPPAAGEASGEVWSVHGGGFYHKQKYQVAPSTMPADLHWFKWEAYWTWISGFSLLVLVYYVGADSYLIDPAKAALTPIEATGIGLAALAVGWLFYDALCRSPLKDDNRAIGVIWFGFLLAAAIVLDRLFNSRGAYLHVGAMIGTVMVGSVFFVIIPNQKRVVADLIAGRTPDPALGKAAKQRSLHNNYMTLPVLFIMVSHHYPMTYGADRPWLVLALLGLTGVAVRHVFNLRHRALPTAPAIAVAAALGAASVTYVSLEKAGRSGAAPAAVAFADVQPILATHCSGCHAPHPTNPAFAAPPLGVLLDSYDHVRAVAPRIKRVAVDAEVMPLGNTTGMTKAERQRLGAWIAAGTPP